MPAAGPGKRSLPDPMRTGGNAILFKKINKILKINYLIQKQKAFICKEN